MSNKGDKSRGRKPGFWIISTTFLVLILLIIPVGLLISISSPQALVVKTSQVDVDSAVSARRTARQFYRGLIRPLGQHSTITLSEAELNDLIALASRGIDGLKGKVRLSPTGFSIDFTVDMPQNPFGQYINLTATIVPSSEGLVVNHLAIGNLPISGEWLISLVEVVLNRVLKDEQLGTELLSSIESVAVNSTELTLVYHTVPDFRRKLAKLKRGVSFIRDDSERVKHYYQDLCRFHHEGGLGNRVSLGVYLSHSFADAAQRSQENDEADEENKAALLALAIFLGSEKFNTVIGALDESMLKNCQPWGSQVVLANRNDLRLHFVFSAALKVISSSGISFSIGEFKELLDTERGGSGFSFADLAADRAGIRFAEFAVDDASAEQLQIMAAELAKEKAFFPLISGLPEGIGQQEFEGRGGIESEFYRKYLSDIERRIDRLQLYQ